MFRMKSMLKIGDATRGGCLRQCANLCLVSLIGLTAQAASPSLDSIKSANEQTSRRMGAASGSMVLVQHSVEEPAAFEEEVHERMASPSLSPRVKEALRASLGRSSVERIRNERRRFTFDLAAERQSIEIEDLRDLAEAILEGRMQADPLTVGNVSKTASAVQDWAHFEGRLFWAHCREALGQLSLEVASPPGVRSMYNPPVYAGIVPRRYWEAFEPARTAITELSTPDGMMTKVRCERETGAVLEMILDPQREYRYRRIEVRYPNGELVHRLTADDYHDVNDIPYPYKQVEEEYDRKTFQLRKTTTVSIESVAFNTKLGPTDFKMRIPKGTTITNLLTSRQRPYKLERDAELTVDDLIELASELQRTMEATGPMNSETFHELIDRLERN